MVWRLPAVDTGSQAAGAWKPRMAMVRSRQPLAQRVCRAAGIGSCRLPRRGIGAGPSVGATRGRRALDEAAGPRALPQRAGKEEDKGPARYIPIKVYFLSTSPELHAAAGSGLAEECTTLGGCRTGMAKMNNGYNLPAS